MGAIHQSPAPSDGVQRIPAFLPYAEGGALFTWYHADASAIARDCVAVLCPPIGFEYAHSHRSVRHLADRLARCGIPALRLDYRGTGDASGTDLDLDRMSAWKEDIRTAQDYAKRCSGRSKVCLIGIRLGASLAALVASEVQVDLLVLWHPVVNGRRYLREMQAVARTASQVSEADAALESGGFVLSAQTQAGISEINLLEERFLVKSRTLVLDREDLSQDPALPQHLAHLALPHDQVAVPGFLGMMAEAQFTVVPQAALEVICAWACTHSAAAAPPAAALITDGHALHPGAVLAAPAFEEQALRFGPQQSLVGILTRPRSQSKRPVIVMFNAGAVHHVGPNRIYVSLARALAALGYACLRFDLAGLGDSIPANGSPENHPYPDAASANAAMALQALKASHGYERFVMLGLCSGAHTGFHAAVETTGFPISELILINPLTFRWVEGMSLATTRQFQDVAYYKQSARSAASWIKLLRGRVHPAKPLKALHSLISRNLKSSYAYCRDRLIPGAGSPVTRHLRRLADMQILVTLIVSEGDPGLDILKAQARYAVARGLKTGTLRYRPIAGADHTFTKAQSRDALVACLNQLLA